MPKSRIITFAGLLVSLVFLYRILYVLGVRLHGRVAGIVLVASLVFAITLALLLAFEIDKKSSEFTAEVKKSL